MFDTPNKFEFDGQVYMSHHGSAFDRGMSDSYYGRKRQPHKGGVGGNSGPRIECSELTAQEIAEYLAGYGYNELMGDYKYE